MGLFDYYASIFKRAGREWWGFLKGNAPWDCAILVAALIIAVIVGQDDALKGAVLGLVVIAAAALICFVLQLMSAPLKIYADQQVRIEQLESKLGPPDASLECEVAHGNTGYIVVRNNGKAARFTTTCNIVKVPDVFEYRKEPPRKVPFKLRWLGSFEKYMYIQKGDTERLIIAGLSQCEPGQHGRLHLDELRATEGIQYDSCYWRNEPDKYKPCWVVEVELFAEELSAPVKGRYSIAVSGAHPRGLLEIKPLD